MLIQRDQNVNICKCIFFFKSVQMIYKVLKWIIVSEKVP